MNLLAMTMINFRHSDRVMPAITFSVGAIVTLGGVVGCTASYGWLHCQVWSAAKRDAVGCTASS